jgi:hypothetical protein
LLLQVAWKKPSSFFSPAGSDQDSARPLAPQPGKESVRFLGVAEIVEAEFQSARLAQPQTELPPHFPRRSGSHYATYAIFSKESLHPSSIPAAKL